MNRRPDRTPQEPPLYCGSCGRKTKNTDYAYRYDGKTGKPVMAQRRECTRWFGLCGWMWWKVPGEPAHTGYSGVY